MVMLKILDIFLGNLSKGVKRKIAGKESLEQVKRRRYIDIVKANYSNNDITKVTYRYNKVADLLNKRVIINAT